MAHLVEPLIEEPVHGLARRLFDGNAKLSGLNWLVRILGQVMMDRTPPFLFAQICTQHVQHGATARVCVSIKDGVRISIVFSDYRTTAPLRPGVEVLILICLYIEVKEIV